jgi:hypothetical protein
VKVTPEEIGLVAQQLAAVAGVFNPGNAAAIALVVQAATTLNVLIHRIRTQTEAEKKQVWDQVSRDFSASLAALEQSMAKPIPAKDQ